MRYHRQTLLPQIGQEGQERLARATVLIVGCGALGTVAAEYLARAGVGTLRLCDRDVIEETNLQRQTLFSEEDAREALPKAIAAARRLARINSSVSLEPHVSDAHQGSIEGLAKDVTVIVDGTDNAQTRYLINDVSIKHGIPWVYGGAVGVEGRQAAFAPPETACLRCVFPDPPGVGEVDSCDTAGVLGPVAGVIGSLQAAAAIRLIVSGKCGAYMDIVDGWTGRLHSMSIMRAAQSACPACVLHRFDFLDAPTSPTAVLCGRNSVQVRPARTTRVALDELATRLAKLGPVHASAYFVKLKAAELELTVFPDGRVTVHGTDSPEHARSIVARYVGF